jgi:hypothetical protein
MEEVCWRKIAAESSEVIKDEEIVTQDITKMLSSNKWRSSFCPPTGSGRQRLPDLSIAQGSVI